MTFTGTRDVVNAALASLTYRPTPQYNGPDTLTLQVNDNGSVSAGGAQTDSDSVSIAVTPVNDASTIGGVSGNVAYTENAVPVVLDPDGTVSDQELGTERDN